MTKVTTRRLLGVRQDRELVEADPVTRIRVISQAPRPLVLDPLPVDVNEAAHVDAIDIPPDEVAREAQVDGDSGPDAGHLQAASIINDLRKRRGARTVEAALRPLLEVQVERLTIQVAELKLVVANRYQTDLKPPVGAGERVHLDVQPVLPGTMDVHPIPDPDVPPTVDAWRDDNRPVAVPERVVASV